MNRIVSNNDSESSRKLKERRIIMKVSRSGQNRTGMFYRTSLVMIFLLIGVLLSSILSNGCKREEKPKGQTKEFLLTEKSEVSRARSTELDEPKRPVQERITPKNAQEKLTPDDGVEKLIKALSSEDDYVRMHAVISLGKKKSVQAVPHLIKVLLEDEEKTARGPAAQALGQIRDERAVKPLIQALSDQDFLVRAFAEEALVNLGKLAIEDIISLFSTTKDQDLRVKLARIVLDMGDLAVDPLISSLDHPNKQIAVGCAVILRSICKYNIDPLITVLEDETNNTTIRSNVAWVLSEIGDEKAIKPLKRVAYNDTSPVVRKYAKEALRKMGFYIN